MDGIHEGLDVAYGPTLTDGCLYLLNTFVAIVK